MARKTTAEIVIQAVDRAGGTLRKIATDMLGLGVSADSAGKSVDRGINKELKDFDALAAAAAADAKRYEQSLKGVKDSAKPAADGVGRFNKQVGESGRNLKSAQGGLNKFITFLKTRFVITLGDVTRLVRAAFDSIRSAADLKSQTNSLRIQLKQQGIAFDDYIGTLKEVSNNTVSTAALIKSSSTALLLGIPAEEISKLLEIASASAIATGQTTQRAFDDIVRGIGRSSPLILDNLGIVVKIGKANADYAAALGKTAEQLTSAEQKQALLNQVLKVGQTRVENFAGAQDETSIALQQGQAAMAGIANVAKRALLPAITAVAVTIVALAQGSLRVANSFLTMRRAWNEWTNDLDDLQSIDNAIDKVDEMLTSLSDVQDKLGSQFKTQLDDLFLTASERTEKFNAKLKEVPPALERVFQTATEAAVGVDEFEESVEGAAATVEAGLVPALQNVEQQFGATAVAAGLTIQSFDALVAASGRVAAISEALSQGGELILGGTRINLPAHLGGGSRLTSEPGFGPQGSNFFSNVSTNGNGRRPGDDAFSRPFL